MRRRDKRMAAGGGAVSPTTTDYSDPISDHGSGKLKEVTYVNPYTWESERARASTKLNRTTKRRNKRRPPGMTIMDRTINKIRKLRESWQEENAGHEADFRLRCQWKDRDVSLKPYLEQPFCTPPIVGDGQCGVSEEVASSVVAIALFDGDIMLFASTAIVLPYRTIQLRRFLTSARLVEVFKENRNKEDELNIRVCLPNKSIVNGFLELYDGDIAVIASLSFAWMHPVELNEYEPSYRAMMSPERVIALGRSFGLCSLMATTVKLTAHESMNPDYSITEAALGGPLVDFSGNFRGMIIDCGSGSTRFMPRHTIFKRLYTFRLLEHNLINVREGGYARKECLDGPNPHGAGSSIGENQTSDKVYSMPPGAQKIAPSGFLRDLDVLFFQGYPEPPPLMLELNGKLLHRFEENFGYLHAWRGYTYNLNICGDGMNAWARLEENIISTISRRVVSLSSYNGNIRFFSCTGLLVKGLLVSSFPQRRTVILTSASLVRTCDEPDTIDKNLRIEVFLPPKQHAIGTLELYDSHHNIAIVSFKGLRAICPEDISDHKQVLPLHVVAIGREPKEGLLCASTGKLTDKPITTLPCKHLELSTCEIKKAGIGGPLINFDDGSFIGMNFYDGKTKGTPFLPRSKILEVLSGLEPMPGRGTQRGGDHPAPILDGRAETNNTKRWPVPQAYWHNKLLKMDWDEGRKLCGSFTEVPEDFYTWSEENRDVRLGATL